MHEDHEFEATLDYIVRHSPKILKAVDDWT